MKNLLTYLPIAILVVSLIGGWFTLKSRAENTDAKVEELKLKVKEEVKEVKNEVKDTDKKITENEKIDIEQTITLKYIQQTLQSLNEKIDREKEAK